MKFWLWKSSIVAGLLVLLFFGAGEAGAVTRYVYSKDSSEIYEIVIDDGKADDVNKNDTDYQAPGIYKIDGGKGKPKLLVPGSVDFANRSYKGVLAYLKNLWGVNFAHDVMSIVDGKLTLLNFNSNPRDPTSVLAVGQPGRGGLPIIDPLSGGVVTLPKINSFDDVQVQEGPGLSAIGDLSKSGRVVLVSVRSPSPLGSGFTFAMLVYTSNPEDKVRVHGNRAIILSYDFMEQSGLASLLVSKDGTDEARVQSPLLIGSVISGLGAAGESLASVRFADHLKEYLKFLSGGRRTPEKVSDIGVPQYELVGFKTSSSFLPVETIRTKNESRPYLGLAYDPGSNRKLLLDLASVSRTKSLPNSSDQVIFVEKDEALRSSIGDHDVSRDPRSGRLHVIPESSKLSSKTDVALDETGASLRDSFLFFDKKGGFYYAAENTQLGQLRQTVPISQVFDPMISPDAKSEFVRLPIIKRGNTSYHVVLFSTLGARSKIASTHVLIIEESSGLRLVAHRKIYTGPFISAAELLLRVKHDDDEPLFDAVTDAHGPKTYLLAGSKGPKKNSDRADSSKDAKTVPYERLFYGSPIALEGGAKSQKYLRTLRSIALIPGELNFREFDPTGATDQMTGFYFRSTAGKAEVFFSGVPIYAQKERGTGFVTYAWDTQRLAPPRSIVNSLPELKVSLVPYSVTVPSPKEKKDTQSDINGKKFSMFVACTVANSSAVAPAGEVKSVPIGYPFGSLAFTKVLQGLKGRSDEVHILLGFREDPKLPGSQNVVVLVNGTVKWNGFTETAISVEFSDPVILHRGLVPPGDYGSFLKVDAEGSYYWDSDPSLAADAPARRVWKLAGIDPRVLARSRPAVALRAADHLDESASGATKGQSAFGGRWELYGRETIPARVAGMADAIDKMDKLGHADEEREGGDGKGEKNAKGKGDRESKFAEEQIIENFLTDLDLFASRSAAEQPGIRVVLVESALKDKFRQALFKRLATKRGNFTLQNPRFKVFYADQTLDDVEVSQEIERIATSLRERSRLLLVESDHLLRSKIPNRPLPERDETKTGDADWWGFESIKEESAKDRFKYDGLQTEASLAALLASDGKAKSAQGFKKLGSPRTNVPALVLATPQEWREILTSEHNQKNYDLGVFDQFEIRTEYLTTAWSLWPPGSDKVSDDIKALGRTPYNVEEMKVFPTLNRILESAAQGQSRGRQIIVVVPPGLKALVQKLILLRWATPDTSAAEPWNHRNRNLALFKIKTGESNQQQFEDNYRAIRGAGISKSSVVLGDLEVVERLGRPVNQTGRNFSIRDPIRPKQNLIDEAFESESSNPSSSSGKSEKSGEGSIEMLRESLEAINADITEAQDAFNLKMAESGRGSGSPEVQAEIVRLKYELDDLIKDRYKIQDQIAEVSDASPTTSSGQSSRDQSNVPHALWWIAAEGQLIQPRRGRDWNLKTAIERSATTLLVGTEEELHRIESDLALEQRYFDVRSHFDIVRLDPPDESTKFNLLQALFDREEIKALGLQFSLNDRTGRDPRSQLIYHFINRTDQIAFDQRIEKVSAFVRAFSVLKSQLVEDLSLRRTRVLDERFLERLFTKVFPMPLNLEILEPTDPLVKIRKVDEAVRGLTKLGYEGSSDLKRRFIENELSQTRATDSSRPIPNSQILFGKTSKGKTFLIATKFKFQGLVEYNPNKPSNAEADYIFIDVAKLTHDQSADPDKVPVQQVISYIYDLLAQPKGSRAHIVFDDFHKAISKEVRQQLFQFIQGLFEAKNGLITVRSKDGKRSREIPVQNLNLYMTLNPASNEKTRAEYIRAGAQYSSIELLKREVLAAISGEGFRPEESVLARWADIINIDSFPRSAKVPELGKRVRMHSRGSREIILVEPAVIDALVERFEDANARELLSPAAAALTSVPVSAEPSRLYIVSPRNRSGTVLGGTAGAVDHQVNLQELSQSVRKLTQIDPVSIGEPKSMLQYMGFLMRNFRLQVFNLLALQAHMSDTLRLNRAGMINVLKTNFVLGIATHVLDKPYLPEREMVIRTQQLSYFDRGQTEEFFRLFGIAPRENFFPPEMFRNTTNDFKLDDFLSGRAVQRVAARTRHEIIKSYVGRVHDLLNRMLHLYLRLDSLRGIRDIGQMNEDLYRKWFDSLPEQNPDGEVKDLMEELLHVFVNFQSEINAPDLDDMKSDAAGSFTIYEEVRLFSYVVDKAVTLLPWGSIGKFAYDVVQMSADLQLGTKTAFKEYIGTHELSPFAISTPEFMTEMLELSREGSTDSGPKGISFVRKMSEGFNRSCASLLNPKQGAQ
jgi:hypothetical protein